jgi:DNA-binding response OmpR family regulator
MNEKKKKILVIEDEPEMSRLLKKRIEAHAFECMTAADPVIGLKKAVKGKPDVIVLDLMLPKMSGLGCLRLLKGNPELTGIPVIVLTALGDEEIAGEAMDLGAVKYLTKACDPKELISAIEAYV